MGEGIISRRGGGISLESHPTIIGVAKSSDNLVTGHELFVYKNYIYGINAPKNSVYKLKTDSLNIVAENNSYTGVHNILVYKDNVFITTNNPGQKHTIKLDLNLNFISKIDHTENNPLSLFCNGDFLYSIWWGGAVINKINIDTFNVVDTITLPGTLLNPTYCKGYLYARQNDNVRKIDIDNWSVVADSGAVVSNSQYMVTTDDGCFIGGYNGEIKKLDLATLNVIASASIYNNPMQAIAANKEYVYASGLQRNVYKFDVATLDSVANLTMASSTKVTNVELNNSLLYVAQDRITAVAIELYSKK